MTAAYNEDIVGAIEVGTSSYAVTVTPTTLTTNRTLTVPDETGTIASQDFATAIAIALG